MVQPEQRDGRNIPNRHWDIIKHMEHRTIQMMARMVAVRLLMVTLSATMDIGLEAFHKAHLTASTNVRALAMVMLAVLVSITSMLTTNATCTQRWKIKNLTTTPARLPTESRRHRRQRRARRITCCIRLFASYVGYMLNSIVWLSLGVGPVVFGGVSNVLFVSNVLLAWQLVLLVTKFDFGGLLVLR
jgi:hypothetical protein